MQELKGSCELEIFRKFIRAASGQELSYVREGTEQLCGTTASCIRAETEQGAVYFLLCEVVDPAAVNFRKEAEARRQDVWGGPVDLFRLPKCFAVMAERRRHFDSGGKPVHLLLYFDSQPSTVCFFERQLPAMAQNTGYDAVWIFNDWTPEVEWRWRRE